MTKLKLAGLCAVVLMSVAGAAPAKDGTAACHFILPPLPYAANALSPAADADTMTIHHDRHHKAYVDSLNATMKDFPALAGESLEDI